MGAMATEDPPLIGTKIRQARERLHWLQRDLAAAVGVDVKTVSNWEHDRAYPRNRIGALEKALGITIYDAAAVEKAERLEEIAALRKRLEVLAEEIEADDDNGSASRPRAG